MNAIELINRVEGLGVTLRVVGDNLRIKAQLGVITPEIKDELRHHKIGIINALRERSTSLSSKRVYRAVILTNGVHKSLTAIVPSGDDLDSFRESCNKRFGADRVISVEPQQ